MLFSFGGHHALLMAKNEAWLFVDYEEIN